MYTDALAPMPGACSPSQTRSAKTVGWRSRQAIAGMSLSDPSAASTFNSPFMPDVGSSSHHPGPQALHNVREQRSLLHRCHASTLVVTRLYREQASHVAVFCSRVLIPSATIACSCRGTHPSMPQIACIVFHCATFWSFSSHLPFRLPLEL